MAASSPRTHWACLGITLPETHRPQLSPSAGQVQLHLKKAQSALLIHSRHLRFSWEMQPQAGPLLMGVETPPPTLTLQGASWRSGPPQVTTELPRGSTAARAAAPVPTPGGLSGLGQAATPHRLCPRGPHPRPVRVWCRGHTAVSDSVEGPVSTPSTPSPPGLPLFSLHRAGICFLIPI